MTSIPDEGQQILAVMPLHAISAVYGEQGLRAGKLWPDDTRNRLVRRVSCGCAPRYGTKPLKGGARCHRSTGSGTRTARS